MTDATTREFDLADILSIPLGRRTRNGRTRRVRRGASFRL